MPAAAVRFSTAPLIETERLRLRAHRVGDYATSMAIWSDREVVRYLSGEPLDGEAVWKRLLQHAGLWSLLGCGSWAIEEKAGGRYIGDIGFLDYKRDIVPKLDGMLEFGWLLAPEAQGRGYASEAVEAIVAWGQAHFPECCMVCIISPENRGSIRVAEKAGFLPWQETVYHGKPIMVFRR
ncbi:GNAT family N-acetyltransferase [Rhodanobacter sp. Col0626]|uniref:GNAT family N-acetyltransferase n=1 Tax=Rhodanobacter sp. Col0626 TaxID=3415679 RepID=UPI003CF17D09